MNKKHVVVTTVNESAASRFIGHEDPQEVLINYGPPRPIRKAGQQTDDQTSSNN